ncbi:hypothetical protein GGR21_001215 [Dysgonomonas hofstadii]|uniref:Uncharacterized protein n=1 Tax=Dysgonomonas hofstadii TaxID=637886 RepID=A0A840CJ11_9BACT|nr:hypothetical protein [Dysgonomonas hofstadii]MBB4035326.1 hypothetical protein [Dysgonomonas hofstadii]
MKQIDIPLLLSFRYAHVQEFVMYTGSRKGAVTCDTTGVEPHDLWADEMKEKENLYKEMGLVFIDDTRLKITPYEHYHIYRLNNGVLEILSPELDKWIPFAYGNRNKLTIIQGLTGIGDIWGVKKKRSLNCNETCWGAFNYAGLSSLSLLKDKKAKIAWCNIYYTFH